MSTHWHSLRQLGTRLSTSVAKEPHELFEAKNRLQTIVKDRNMSNQEYMDRFQNAVDFIIHIAESILVYPSLVDERT